jgi:hypothetical protein
MDLKDVSLEDTLLNIQRFLHNPADLIKIDIPNQAGAILYFDGLVDQTKLLEALKCFGSEPFNIENSPWKQEIRGLKEVLNVLPQGHAVLIYKFKKQMNIYSLALPGWQLRPIEEPISEPVIRGPREGFTETLSVNTAMIRRWINDSQLRVDQLIIGNRSKTKVRLLYLNDVANPALIKEVKGRISAIRIDGILESGYLEELITDNRLTLFPLIQSTERSDKVTAAILEGRVAVLVDKSPFVLIVPTTVNELYQSTEDYYFGFYLGSFLRFIRLLGNNLAVTLPGLYIALASFNPELLPTSFAFSIAQSRYGIPYPIFMEILFLEIMVEVFREAGLRLPKNVNQTLGVVAGVGLAFAAVQSRLVSGASLAVVSITAIASFSSPSFSVGTSWRILKFILILGASLLGIVGLTLAGILILAHAATLTSFGTSYLAPWAPLQWRELRDSIFRAPLWLRFNRPAYYHPLDRSRMGKTQKNEANQDE